MWAWGWCARSAAKSGVAHTRSPILSRRITRMRGAVLVTGSPYSRGLQGTLVQRGDRRNHRLQAEVARDSLARSVTELAAPHRIGGERLHGGAKRSDIFGRHQNSAASAFEDLRHASDVADDDRQAGGHRFEHRDGQALPQGGHGVDIERS